MLSPEVAQAAVRIGVFMLLVSGALLGLQQPGTAEFVVTVATFVISSVSFVAPGMSPCSQPARH